MSILAKVFQASSIVDLETAVNAFLAGLVGGSAVTIIQVSIKQNLLPRRQLKQTQLQCVITYNTAPVGAQATPFVLNLIQSGNVTDFQTALNAAMAVGGLLFVSGVRVISDDEPAQIPQLMGWILTSTDAGASANYLNI